MRKLKGKVDYIQEFFVFFDEIFLNIVDFLMKSMFILAIDLDSRQGIHKLRPEQLEILMDGLIRVYDDGFILLNNEQISRKHDFSYTFFARLKTMI